MEKIELLPCPFCGDSAYITPLNDENDRRYWFCVVSCVNCEAKIKEGVSWTKYGNLGDKAEKHVQRLAADAWNTRSNTDISAAVNLAVSEALEQAASIPVPLEPCTSGGCASLRNRLALRDAIRALKPSPVNLRVVPEVQALIKAAKELKADMLARSQARIDVINGEQYRIVNAGNTAWSEFTEALKDVENE